MKIISKIIILNLFFIINLISFNAIWPWPESDVDKKYEPLVYNIYQKFIHSYENKLLDDECGARKIYQLIEAREKCYSEMCKCLQISNTQNMGDYLIDFRITVDNLSYKIKEYRLGNLNFDKIFLGPLYLVLDKYIDKIMWINYNTAIPEVIDDKVLYFDLTSVRNMWYGVKCKKFNICDKLIEIFNDFTVEFKRIQKLYIK